MDSIVKIGPEVGSIEASTKAIQGILKSVSVYAIEPTVAVAAFKAFTETTKIKNVTISNCTFTGINEELSDA